MDQFELRYTFEKETDITRLESAWSELERISDASFFLSWSWISRWSLTIDSHLYLCSVYFGEKLIALGLFVPNGMKRHRVLTVKQLRLHSTGIEEHDQIWPEYNGMLIENGFEDQVYSGLIAFLEQQSLEWDELVIGPVERSTVSKIELSSTIPLKYWEAPTYRVNLLQLKLKQSKYLDSLSKNTRQQIRRSIRHYESQGELKLIKAETIKEAMGFFDAIGLAHKRRWGGESGFYNSYFVEFHHGLIEKSFPNGSVDLVKLQVNNNAIGYLYNFIYRNKVLFYLSGLDCLVENKFKPGLVLHSMCIQSYMDDGIEEYDFLGGEAQYKKSLGSEADRLSIIYYQKQVAKLRIESRLRSLKQVIQTASSSS